MIHELPLERRTLHGHFSPDLAPVLTVDPGDSVVFRSLSSGWRWEPDGEFLAERDHVLDGGHALNGPVEVRGAKAGDTLVVHIDEVRPGGWGVTFGDGTPFSWTIGDGRATDGRGATVALSPFLGVIGMPPPEPGVHSTAPPRRWGGNIDCTLLVAGTTLYLPIPVDGALLSAGDGHGAQGDGEVSGTAIECPLERAQLTLEVLNTPELRMPVARTADAWVAFGFGEDLDVAAELATETMLDLMRREHGLDRAYALALASVVVDLRVTQLVNGVKGVHAVLRDDALRSQGR
ncbi:MAG TPA: acetamidase/formamidase family protein [Gaiellaceae bacterium]|nr:acetamidase/formamidase family protein [Gaiellaceae bacterium]